MRVNRTVELTFTLFVMVALPIIAVAHEKNVASEFLEVAVEEEMKSMDVLALLDQTVGEMASSSTHPITHQLRQGLLVTAIPQGRNVILRFEVTKSDTGLGRLNRSNSRPPIDRIPLTVRFSLSKLKGNIERAVSGRRPSIL